MLNKTNVGRVVGKKFEGGVWKAHAPSTRILHETCSKLSNSDFGIRKIDWRGNVFDQSIKNSI
jgi:hypothetical protein